MTRKSNNSVKIMGRVIFNILLSVVIAIFFFAISDIIMPLSLLLSTMVISAVAISKYLSADDSRSFLNISFPWEESILVLTLALMLGLLIFSLPAFNLIYSQASEGHYPTGLNSSSIVSEPSYKATASPNGADVRLEHNVTCEEMSTFIMESDPAFSCSVTIDVDPNTPHSEIREFTEIATIYNTTWVHHNTNGELFANIDSTDGICIVRERKCSVMTGQFIVTAPSSSGKYRINMGLNKSLDWEVADNPDSQEGLVRVYSVTNLIAAFQVLIVIGIEISLLRLVITLWGKIKNR